MINPKSHIDRISCEHATDVFTLAAQLQAQKQHNYSHAELMQAALEAGISPEIMQEAIHMMQFRQIQDQPKLKRRLILGSAVAGAAIALCGLWVYNVLTGPAFAKGYAQAKLAPENSAPFKVGKKQAFEQKISTFSGVVQQYLLDPEGRVDGLLLKDGLQVKFPPHMSNSLTALVTPGTNISVTGNAGVVTRFGQEVRAEQITNQKTQKTLVIQPPAEPMQPIASNYSNLSIAGNTEHWLVGRRGEINGMILASGVQVKFPPRAGEQFTSIANVGDKVQVQGFGTRNDRGEVIQATNLTVNGQSLSVPLGHKEHPL